MLLVMLIMMMMMTTTHVPAREFAAATASQGHTCEYLTHKLKYTAQNVKESKTQATHCVH
jgi:hypothetical protein